jgi:hypothetical protein
MEDLLEKYKEHPTVKLIYFPTEVNRKESLLKGKMKERETKKMAAIEPM